MSVVARWCHTRYYLRMTELKPVAYAASVAVFLVIVAYAAAVQWSPVFRAKTVQAGWTLIWAAQWQLGKMVGVATWILEKTAWGAYCLAELWFPPVATILFGWIQGLWKYQGLRAYVGVHAG